MARRSTTTITRKRNQFVIYPTDEFKLLLRRVAERLSEEREREVPMTEVVRISVEDFARRRRIE